LACNNEPVLVTDTTNTSTPSQYTYTTTDSIETVMEPDYFQANSTGKPLEIGDVITVYTGGQSYIIFVAAIAPVRTSNDAVFGDIVVDSVTVGDLDPDEGVYTDSASKLTSDIPTTGILGYWARDAINGYVYTSDLDDYIGIGTVTPVTKLDVNGAITARGAADGQSIIASGLVVNEDGNGTAADDFRAETVSEANALVVDASGDEILANVPLFTTGININTTTQTATYIALITDDVIICNHATVAFPVTLPIATGSGKILHTKNINAAEITLTADATGTADKIDGDATQPIAQWECITVQDYETDNWVVI
jgi:hypothetical protein